MSKDIPDIAHLRQVSQIQRQQLQEGETPSFTAPPVLGEQLAPSAAPFSEKTREKARGKKKAVESDLAWIEDFDWLDAVEPEALTAHPKKSYSTRIRTSQDAALEMFRARFQMHAGRSFSKESLNEIIFLAFQNNPEMQEWVLREMMRRVSAYNNNL